MTTDAIAYAAALIERLDIADAAVRGPASDTIRAAVTRQRRVLLDAMAGMQPAAPASLPKPAGSPRNPTDEVAALARAYAAAAQATEGQPGPLPELFERFEREIEAIVAGA